MHRIHRMGPGALVALVFLVLGVGCAGRVEQFGEVQVRQGSSARSLRPSAVTRRSVAAVAVIHTDIGRGMGFVIDERGYLLTNRHVVEDADHVEKISFPASGREFSSVRIVYMDPDRDLGLLKIEADEPLDWLPLASGGRDEVGDYLRRQDPVILLERVDEETERERRDDSKLVSNLGKVTSLAVENRYAGPGSFVGLTTDVHRGQSGGPVLDRYGRAVGVVTWSWRDRSGGYAIPIADAIEMLAERPRLDHPDALTGRAERRARSFIDALQQQEFEQARRMTSPSYAKEIREQAVVEIMSGIPGNKAVVFRGFVGALEAMADEQPINTDRDAFRLLQRAVGRTGSSAFRKALGINASVPESRIFAFFYEFGQAYIAARHFGGRSAAKAVEEGVMRLQTVDAARTFALAELTGLLAHVDPDVERVEIIPGAYGPRAVAVLSEVDDGRMLVLTMRMEWGDWYVAAIDAAPALDAVEG